MTRPAPLALAALVLLWCCLARAQIGLTKPANAERTPPSSPHESAPNSEAELQGWGDARDDSAGFAKAAPREQTKAPEVAAANPLSLNGFVRSQWGLWLERWHDNPLAKARQNLDLQLRYSTEHLRAVVAGHGEYDVAYRVNRDSYDPATLDVYEHLIDLRESYVSASFAPVEFTFGRLIVPWGQGDVVSVLDVTNPRDLREPGLADLDDLRLPVTATRFGFFFGYHRIDALIIHESAFGYRPAPLGDFSPVRALIQHETGLDPDALAHATDVRYADRDAGFVFDGQQYALSWSYKGPVMDAALYLASVRDQFGVFAGLDPPLRLPAIPKSMNVVLEHPRYALIGYAGAVPFGNWLVKWEFGVSPSREYNLQPAPGKALEFLLAPAGSTKRAPFAGAMLGLTYSGLPNTLLFIEAGQNTPIEEAGVTLFGANQPTFALRSMHTLFDDNLRADLTFYAIGWSLDYGFLARAELVYRLNDALKLGLGAITYHPGSKLGVLSGLDRHDRLFGSLRWDFSTF